jgi:hypothetical protein
MHRSLETSSIELMPQPVKKTYERNNPVLMVRGLDCAYNSSGNFQSSLLPSNQGANLEQESTEE